MSKLRIVIKLICNLKAMRQNELPAQNKKMSTIYIDLQILYSIFTWDSITEATDEITKKSKKFRSKTCDNE